MTEFLRSLPPATSGWDGQRQKIVERFAADLRRHPGLWAKYPLPQTYIAARAAATRIRRGRVRAFAAGFEAVTRGEVLYVRYVGE